MGGQRRGDHGGVSRGNCHGRLRSGQRDAGPGAKRRPRIYQPIGSAPIAVCRRPAVTAHLEPATPQSATGPVRIPTSTAGRPAVLCLRTELYQQHGRARRHRQLGSRRCRDRWLDRNQPRFRSPVFRGLLFARELLLLRAAFQVNLAPRQNETRGVRWPSTPLTQCLASTPNQREGRGAISLDDPAMNSSASGDLVLGRCRGGTQLRDGRVQNN